MMDGSTDVETVHETKQKLKLQLYIATFWHCSVKGLATMVFQPKKPGSLSALVCNQHVSYRGKRHTIWREKAWSFIQNIFGSEILPMVDQWPFKDNKFNNRIAPPRSLLRNQKTAPFERAQSGLFSAIFFLPHCSGYWGNRVWNFQSYPYLVP